MVLLVKYYIILLRILHTDLLFKQVFKFTIWSIIYRHGVVQQTSRTCSFFITKTVYLLIRNTLFPLPVLG